MSVQVEKLEKSMTKLTIELSAEQFEDAMKKAFNKSGNKLNTPGFHKDKASRAIIERMYGEGIFYENAADEAISAACMETMNESGLEIVSRPEVAVDQVGKDGPFVYTATIAVRSEVTLGEYKGIEVEKADAAVKLEDMETGLRKVQEQDARPLTVEDRPVTDGDQTVISLEGFVDGKMFDGGKAADHPLTIGSHSFIDTFEEQLVGEGIGEECEINVTFLEEHHAAELTGEPVVFKVTVKEIRVKELPGLDDKFTGEVSEFDTPDEYKKDIEAEVLEGKRREAASESGNRIVDRVVAGASVGIPDKMMEGQIGNMVQDTVRCIESQGLSMDLYMKYTGMTVEQMREQMKPQALKGIQTRLVLEEVVKAESLQVSDERLDEGIAEMTAAYQVEADRLKGCMSDRDKDQVKEDIAVQEAVDLLVTEAKLV